MIATVTATTTSTRPAQALNDAQRRAALHGSGAEAARPLLVIAGAGTGKTSTLAHRVAHLVAGGADPQRVLLLTFSRRAAEELERRVGKVLQAQLKGASGERPPAFEWAGTFHGVGARLLREYAERVGLASNFTIHDRGDSEDLMGLVRHDHLGVDPVKGRFPGAATCVAIYSRSVNSEAPLADVLRTSYPWCADCEEALRRLFDAYVAAKQAQQVLDFDDLLLYWAAMMTVPALAQEVGARFDHVLVDEYQDTNRLQGSIVRALKPDGRGVTVVGDDAQAIYGFRAATVRNILDFPRQYDPPADVITLERNYRSTAAILDASNAVIALAKERYAKDLVTDRSAGERPRLVTVADEMAQARHVAEQVLLHRENGIALKRQAVLFRTSSHSALLELELARRNIPFVKFGGLRFLDAAHVKDVLSLLRWIENPRGRLAGFRTLRLLPGVGPATSGRWLDALAGATDTLAAMRGFAIPAAASQEWPGLLKLCEALQRGRSDWPAEMDALLAWYEPQLERLYEDAAIRAPDLAQLRRVASTFATRERFLTELTLDPPAVTSGEAADPLLDEDWLTLSTIHSAKGQEWRVVQVLNCVDGCIPSDMATGSVEEIEEERRLLYVAMTRAMDHLSLVMPQRFHVRQQAAMGDRHVYASASRFLTNAVCAHFDRQSWPAADAQAKAARSQGPKVDLRALIRGAWSPGGAGEA
ncbi:MAG TPA: ATP-dependent helicase [Casimicrobiaceae bacterium]|nr:ATP-dependent helicase [Casimicrobiaceae bacterium]